MYNFWNDVAVKVVSESLSKSTANDVSLDAKTFECAQSIILDRVGKGNNKASTIENTGQ